METTVAYQKNTGPVQVLQGTGAGISELNPEQINSAGKLDHFPVTCDRCGQPLVFSDLVGKHEGSVFVVKGYRCPACRHKVGTSRIKNANRSYIPFDWKLISISGCGRFPGRGDIS